MLNTFQSDQTQHPSQYSGDPWASWVSPYVPHRTPSPCCPPSTTPAAASRSSTQRSTHRARAHGTSYRHSSPRDLRSQTGCSHGAQICGALETMHGNGVVVARDCKELAIGREAHAIAVHRVYINRRNDLVQRVAGNVICVCKHIGRIGHLERLHLWRWASLKYTLQTPNVHLVICAVIAAAAAGIECDCRLLL